jgi:hypothetical protein
LKYFCFPEGSAKTFKEKEKKEMKKIVILLTGVVFILGVMLPLSYAQPKQEKQSPMGGIPKQNTTHIGVDKKDAAAPEQKAVTAEPPAPADTKAPATQQTKKDKKAKKSKKTKNTPQN